MEGEKIEGKNLKAKNEGIKIEGLTVGLKGRVEIERGGGKERGLKGGGLKGKRGAERVKES